jgi:hypothetical protein
VVLNSEVRDDEEVWGAFIGSLRRFEGKIFLCSLALRADSTGEIRG